MKTVDKIFEITEDVARVLKVPEEGRGAVLRAVAHLSKDLSVVEYTTTIENRNGSSYELGFSNSGELLHVVKETQVGNNVHRWRVM